MRKSRPISSICALSAPTSLSRGALCTQLNGEAYRASHSSGSLAACATAACSLLLITTPLTVPAQAAASPVVDPAVARSPELSETSTLSDRRFVGRVRGALAGYPPVARRVARTGSRPGRGGAAIACQADRGVGRQDQVGRVRRRCGCRTPGLTYTTTVTRHGRIDLRIGAVLPDGATVASATLNGSPVKLMLVKTTRGLEALAKAEPGQRTATLVITIAP